MSKFFKFRPFSRKQRQVLNWWCKNSPVRDHDGIIADGAIRAGKTLPMSLSFVMWSMSTYNGENFAMCGKTIASFRRNVLTQLKLMLKSRGYTVEEKRSENMVIVSRGKRQNSFYIFGGKDEAAQSLIQGITLAGIYFDEVALMPESFVNQGTARCSVNGAKFWFNCNPEGPSHWFKKNWIDKRQEKNLLYLHFDMNDNLSLSEKTKKRYRSMYSGVFFKRFILGLWVAAEGAIYIEFAAEPDVYILDTVPDDIEFCVLGMDFGGHGSAHAIVCSGFSRKLQRFVVLDEYYRKEVISPDVLEQDTVRFVRSCQERFPKAFNMYCDSAEQVLIQGIKQAFAREHIPINVHNARKGEINERIRFFCSLMSQRRFFVMRGCGRVIEALQAAVWNPKKLDDERLDDGTTNIDSLDALEYSAEKYMNTMMKVR